MADKNQKLSSDILDEVWTLMRYATVKVNEKKKKASSDNYIKVMPDHFQWECSVVSSDEESTSHDKSGDKSYLYEDEAIYSSADDEDVDEPIHTAAEQLANMGDKICEEKEAGDKLIQDITKYLLTISPQIEDKIGQCMGRARPPEEIFQDTIVTTAYNTFKSKLQSFLGIDESVNKIAVVTHVARGVASGFKDSDLPLKHLISVLSYKFVSEKYQVILEKHGSVTNLAKAAKDPESHK